MTTLSGRLLTLLLLVLGLIYVGNGVLMLSHPVGLTDLSLRLHERDYLWRGIDPYDVSGQFTDVPPTAAEARRRAEQGLGREPSNDPSGYPPWGLGAMALFLPPGSGATAAWIFSVVCLCALGYALSEAWRRGRPKGAWEAMLLVAALLAMFGNNSTLRMGQFGLLLNAALFLALRAERLSRPLRLGFAAGLLAIKPSFSLYHLLGLTLRRQWLALFRAGVLAAALSVVPWALTGVNPWEMTGQMLRQAAAVSKLDTSLLRVAGELLGSRLGALVLLLGGAALTVGLAWKCRRRPLLLQACIAMVAGRLFLYHRQYDNVMLAFPLLALGMVALETRRKGAWTMFLLFGASLWAPIPYRAYSTWTILPLALLWLAGLGYLVAQADALQRMEGEAEGPGRDGPVIRKDEHGLPRAAATS